MRFNPLLVAIVATLAMNGCGKPKGDLQTGIAAFDRKDYAAATREIQPLAEHGSVQAQYYMARLAQANDALNSRTRDAEVVDWYRKAAEQGHLESQLMLADIYARGMGVRENGAEALKWFRRAADQGDARSLSALAWHYGKPGPEQDLVASYALGTIAGERDPRFQEIPPKVAQDMSDEQIQVADRLANRLRARGAVVSVELNKER
ncbi:MAG: sel1 repeat family protein [Rhodocyclales bacterium]|nr:sel1 repeat family protein [Rhodocyclales bacterium]